MVHRRVLLLLLHDSTRSRQRLLGSRWLLLFSFFHYRGVDDASPSPGGLADRHEGANFCEKGGGTRGNLAKISGDCKCTLSSVCAVIGSSNGVISASSCVVLLRSEACLRRAYRRTRCLCLCLRYGCLCLRHRYQCLRLRCRCIRRRCRPRCRSSDPLLRPRRPRRLLLRPRRLLLRRRRRRRRRRRLELRVYLVALVLVGLPQELEPRVLRLAQLDTLLGG